MLHPVVMLFDMTDGSLSLVPATTFAAEGVLERTHLQRALRSHIQILGDGLLVVSEEFWDFQDARRRIDLRCVPFSPYPRVDRLLPDSTPATPLPESKELTIALRGR